MNKTIIYLEDAIKALGEEPEVWMDDDDYTLGQRNQWRYDVTVLEAVSPVHIEALTDYEQRIFLAAMAREKAVCEKVDAEWSNENNNLVRICNAIERKVKAALWKV